MAKKMMKKEKMAAAKMSHDFSESEMKMGHRKIESMKPTAKANDGAYEYDKGSIVNDSDANVASATKVKSQKKVGKGGMH